MDDSGFDVTYTPYVNGQLTISPTLTSGLFQLSSTTTAAFFQIQVPIEVDYNNTQGICFQASSTYTPMTVSITANNSILECNEDLSDFAWVAATCDFNDQLTFTLYSYDGGDAITYDIQDETCFS